MVLRFVREYLNLGIDRTSLAILRLVAVYS
jgi:hypothetical protein